MEKKRYVSMISLYITAESDEDAVTQSTEICKKLNEQHDCHADTEGLYFKPYGSRTALPIKGLQTLKIKLTDEQD